MFCGALQAPGAVAGVLRSLVNLHVLRRLEADMGWLLTEGILPLEAARGIPKEIRCFSYAPGAHPFRFLPVQHRMCS